MLIGNIREKEINTRTKDQESAPPISDVDFFNALLPPQAFASTAISTAPSMRLLSEASNTLDSMTKNMTKSLRALTSKDKHEEARKYPSQLSDAVLLQHVLTKCVGKTAQGIDKICNLQ